MDTKNPRIGYIDSFKPANTYCNTAADDTVTREVYLDLSNFEEIRYSSPRVLTANDGRKYVELKAGAEVTYIDIYGDYKKPIESIRLSELLKLKTGDRVYVNKNLEKLIINGDEAVTVSQKDILSKKANIVEIKFSKGELTDFNACFVVDSKDSDEDSFDIRSHALSYTGPFEYLYFYDKKSKDYVAYNTYSVVQGVTRNSDNPIRIGKSFTPKIADDERVLYIIEEAVPVNNSHSFEVMFYDTKGKRNWAATDLPIEITADLKQEDSNSYLCEELKLHKEFDISNHISLEDYYELENETIELGRYIISVPDNINVVYENRTVKIGGAGDTDCYVENDGFNKLPHANIVSIDSLTVDGKELDRSDYSLMTEPGYISWKNTDYYGKPFKVVYTYKKPVELTFSSLDSLYEIVDYKIDTLERIYMVDEDGAEKPYIMKQLLDGDNRRIDFSNFPEIPEKVAVVCSNPVYAATVTMNLELDPPEGQIHISKIADDHVAIKQAQISELDGDVE